MADYTRHVKQSFENRVQGQLEGTYPVDWEGASFDAEGEAKWIEPRSLGQSNRPTNSGKRVESWTFQINCYVRIREGDPDRGGNTVWEMADDVIDAFRDVDVDVVDWDESSTPRTSVGTLEFYHPDATPVPNDTPGLKQVSVTLEPDFNNLSI